ncbi:histidine kinase dimerization/phospho-acceptor domain-containing protein [Dactylosporangium sp. NPDC000521]|uniref:HAMP domain-containing sensor histidine kinase n=1 Tax=Dactylosporangium sp. NPDC000521 TaxID=3363975 RepID=UPI0036A5CB1C
MPRSGFRSIAARSALVTCLVAVISVLVTALVGAPLAVQEANRAARIRLADEATLTAELLRPRFNTPRSTDEQVIVERLRNRGIEVYLIRAGQADREGLPDGVVRTVGAGRQVPVRRAMVDQRVRFVVGRPVGNAGNGVVLTERVPSRQATIARLWGQLWMALLAGLAAGLLAGVLLARRIARPIRTVADAANRLTAGDRSVTLDADGPAEVADLAHAVNALTAALATSEGRERDFLLSVSHELRTPLTTIRGYAEALADGVVGPDGAQRAGQTVLDEAERLDRLIADLLVLARLEAADLPVEVVDVDLTQLVAATAEAWGGRLTAAGLLLRTELPPMPVPVRTDPGRVRQIVDGLLENALRVVPSEQTTGVPVVLALVWGPAEASIEIRDGGPGFTDDDLAVAFERGALSRRYQGARKVGSGLGLALAARMARRLGGRIEAGHAPEGGARFTVTVPFGPGERR